MISVNKIRYCSRKEIDILKWDRCIDEADNGLIYASSTYLDIMVGKWDALILNNYEAVMPLTWNRKYGLYYLYQPYFIPSLGVFGLKDQDVTLTDFLMTIPKKFKYWHIKLNESNRFTAGEVNLQIDVRTGTNYLLSLNKPYQEITSGYKRLCKRMIKKAADSDVNVFREGKPGDAIEFYRELYKDNHKHISHGTYSRLITAATFFFEKKEAKTYLAKLPSGEVTAVYLVLVDKRFVYSLIGGSSEKGKDTGSFYLLTDAAIKDNSDTNRIFRFEGSDIRGVAFFDAKFGPEQIKYLQLISNKLPFPFSFFKSN